MNRRIKSINLGDKIFARVTRNGSTILNYVTEKVATISQLISELRLAMKDIHGLVMIHIRNYNQGWGEERPLMLYAEKVRNFATYRATQNMGITNNPEKVSAARSMLFPWETH